VVLAAALAVFSVAAVFAQNGSGKNNKKEDPNLRNVEGTVLGLDQKPVAKAIVQLKDARTVQVRSFVTQEDGKYHFAGLRTTNDYELQATFEDLKSSTKRLSTFDNRKTATLVLQLEKK
jgi:protocatechuate 3,4-dioxygenase beta subunit